MGPAPAVLETGRPAIALDRLARGLADTLDSQDITAYIQALEAIIAEQQKELHDTAAGDTPVTE